MTEGTNRLPPQVRSLIAREISKRRSLGVVTSAAVLERVRSLCPVKVSDRVLEDAIAEEAVAAGLAVHFNVTSAGKPDF